MLRPRRSAFATVSFFSVAALALLACGSADPTGDSTGSAASPESPASLEAPASLPTELHFTVSTSIVKYPPPELHVTLVNEAAVRNFFVETLALPPAPPAAGGCPVDYGIAYHLVFVTDQGTTTADLDPSGCETITIDGGTVLSAASTPKYWYDLSRVLQVEESAIYPYDPAAHS